MTSDPPSASESYLSFLPLASSSALLACTFYRRSGLCDCKSSCNIDYSRLILLLAIMFLWVPRSHLNQSIVLELAHSLRLSVRFVRSSTWACLRHHISFSFPPGCGGEQSESTHSPPSSSSLCAFGTTPYLWSTFRPVSGMGKAFLLLEFLPTATPPLRKSPLVSHYGLNGVCHRNHFDWMSCLRFGGKSQTRVAGFSRSVDQASTSKTKVPFASFFIFASATPAIFFEQSMQLASLAECETSFVWYKWLFYTLQTLKVYTEEGFWGFGVFVG